MPKPFLCANCGNYYVEVDVKDKDGRVLSKDEYKCLQCADNKHAVHPRTGKIDCHWGQASASASEAGMTKTLTAVITSKGKIEKLIKDVAASTTKEQANLALDAGEAESAAVLSAERSVAELMRFAGVMEMPGKRGDDFSERFKTLEQVEQFIKIGRRPQEDADVLKRSLKNCADLQVDIEREVGRAKILVQQLRERAMNFKERQVPVGAK